ncbi:DEAD/DEAH box helicase [Arenivirga flava]|uniref:DEAD/DEAH box helicase n=1 Tax=Arenivirga flava TaxID=1930060 RepID=A0AA37XCB0_9MICO|nr:DEAD/DEAH box helicase [Arenivirga flava]GMA29578.1 DEAD/DEAH box helicase [Arenivirga flava]
MSSEYWDEVGRLEAFAAGVRQSTILTTVNFFDSALVAPRVEPPDWARALFAASLVSMDAPEALQSGAIRIVQGCLQDRNTSTELRRASTYLLRRLGNSRAVGLAIKRGLIDEDLRSGQIDPLGLDLARSRLEMTVGFGSEAMPVNPFQRQFWDAASRDMRVSVSAPTAAGKSHIVKMWIKHRASMSSNFSAAYVVPTRALIDEVSAELREVLAGVAEVLTLPWDARVGQSAKEVYVVTQERLHLILNQDRERTFDVVFIDEAQKLGDGRRGILLQRVIDQVTVRGNPQLIFASPLTENPETLVSLGDGTSSSLLSETVTVNQTLLHANQIPRKRQDWTLDIVMDGETHKLGTFALPARPIPESKRLPLVAVALGREHPGNVIYANGAAEAEKYAGQVYDALGPSSDISSGGRIDALIELVQKTIHPKYLLGQYLRRGVAFHYGNMPLIVREEIASLFKNGEIHFLVCTSTLLEGVNLPCQNLFVRAPRKGQGNPMSPADFWNLAGRAGRWGVEFQGNIICVDADKDAWEFVPLRRTRQEITRATDRLTREHDDLVEYVLAGTPVATSKADPELEGLFAILASAYWSDVELENLPWLRVDESVRRRLEEATSSALSSVSVHQEILRKHADISPLSIQRLSDALQSSGRPVEHFALAAPESEESLPQIITALGYIDAFLGGDFTDNEARHYGLALLFTDWMRGRPLSMLIASRISWLNRTGKDYKLPAVIRDVLADVETYARFMGPRYLACYSDVVTSIWPPVSPDEEIPDISMMMELGVSRVTELSMMSIGVSRTSAVVLSEYIVDDGLNPQECVEWLLSRDLSALGLPSLIEDELGRILLRHVGLS